MADERNRPMQARAPEPAANTMRDAEPPALPRPRMPLAQRAKIFIPFDPLKGYQDALREKEREAEMLHNELGGLDSGFEIC